MTARTRITIGNPDPSDLNPEARRHAVACQQRDAALIETETGWVCEECHASTRR